MSFLFSKEFVNLTSFGLNPRHLLILCQLQELSRCKKPLEDFSSRGFLYPGRELLIPSWLSHHSLVNLTLFGLNPRALSILCSFKVLHNVKSPLRKNPQGAFCTRGGNYSYLMAFPTISLVNLTLFGLNPRGVVDSVQFQGPSQCKKPLEEKSSRGFLYPGRDLNPHGRNVHRILSPACLPIPPPGRTTKQRKRLLSAPCICLSEKRDSNPRPQPWQGCALPTELFSLVKGSKFN